VQIASFLLYLSNVEAGGETMFPYEVDWEINKYTLSDTLHCEILTSKKSFEYSNLQGGLHIDKDYDYRKCIGLKVKPRQGDGLLFYSLLPNGEIDKVIFHFQIYEYSCRYFYSTHGQRNFHQAKGK